ncbi:hypothetical protein T4E_6389 [Trichinella pseudospiralis]|uniref:Uncharacterized protein n=1 Tax=Trichinella pseudospiralis TaxID=6337 RepID=A0A0V0XDA2_TRIPS|nr:hypothetical protein T4E_6389 [Trichinella pseudospiralis]
MGNFGVPLLVAICFSTVQTEFDIFSVGHRHLISACDIDQVSTPFPDNTEKFQMQKNVY